VQEKFVSACQLYVAFGFITAEPVSFNPVPGTSFLGFACKPVRRAAFYCWRVLSNAPKRNSSFHMKFKCHPVSAFIVSADSRWHIRK
jgi:hypothetical protein